MRCDCFNCECNTDGYCDISPHITIDENGQCNEMLIRSDNNRKSRNKNTT